MRATIVITHTHICDVFAISIYATYVYHMYMYIYASDDCKNTHIYATCSLLAYTLHMFITCTYTYMRAMIVIKTPTYMRMLHMFITCTYTVYSKTSYIEWGHIRPPHPPPLFYPPRPRLSHLYIRAWCLYVTRQ